MTQEDTEQTCIEENWPWEDAIPVSIEELMDGVETIRTECAATQTLYAQQSANIRERPSTKADKVGSLGWAEQVEARCEIEGDAWRGSDEWCDVGEGYVHSLLLGLNKPVAAPRPAEQAAPATDTDVCSGYHHCFQVCTYQEGAKFWFGAFGLGASRYWKSIDNCWGQDSGKIYSDYCGGGGQFDTIWANDGLYLRWRCP